MLLFRGLVFQQYFSLSRFTKQRYPFLILHHKQLMVIKIIDLFKQDHDMKCYYISCSDLVSTCNVEHTMILKKKLRNIALIVKTVYLNLYYFCGISRSGNVKVLFDCLLYQHVLVLSPLSAI